MSAVSWVADYLADSIPYLAAAVFISGTIVRSPSARYWLWAIVLLRPLLPFRTEIPLISVADERVIGAMSHLGVAQGGSPAVSEQITNGGAEFEIFTAWLVASAVLIAAAFIPRLLLALRLRSLSASTHPAVTDAIRKVSSRMPGKAPRVVIAPVRVPYTIGWHRPVIVLPRTLLDAPKHQIEAAIFHEAVHVARRDDLRLQFELLMRAIFFFDPSVWVASLKLRRTREQLCDARVLDLGLIDRREYGLALLELSQSTSVSGPVSALFGSRAEVRDRIVQMVRPRGSSAIQVAAVLLCLALVPITVSVAVESRLEVQELPGVELLNPVPGAHVSSDFGQRMHPTTGEPVHHDGIDLVAPRGTPVRAAASGVVRTATRHYTRGGSFGRVVEIAHEDGLITVYAHMHRMAVAEGDTVIGGEQIGTVGSTGVSTGPHLHFEVWVDNQPVAPAEYLKKASD